MSRVKNEQDGWFGKVRHRNGKTIMTEISMEIDGIEFPVIYPGITFNEIQTLKNIQVNNEGESLKDIPSYIITNAFKAAQRRIKEGKNPFYEPGVDTSGATSVTDTDNMLNMVSGGYIGESGKTYGDDREHSFVIMDSAEYSVRASFYQLFKDIDSKEGKLYEIIKKFSPKTDDNNVMAYTKSVHQQLTGIKGVPEDVLLGYEVGDAQIVELVKAMNLHENGRGSETTAKWNSLIDSLLQQYGTPEALGANIDFNPGRYPLITTTDSNRTLWREKPFANGKSRYERKELFDTLANKNNDGVNYFDLAKKLMNGPKGNYEYVNDPRLGLPPANNAEIALHSAARELYEADYMKLNENDKIQFGKQLGIRFGEHKNLLEKQEQFLRLHKGYEKGWASVATNQFVDPKRWTGLREALTNSTNPGDYSSLGKNAIVNLAKVPIDSEVEKQKDLQERITDTGFIDMNKLLQEKGTGRKVEKDKLPPDLSGTVPGNEDIITQDALRKLTGK